jgi:hypothetical protein
MILEESLEQADCCKGIKKRAADRVSSAALLTNLYAAKHQGASLSTKSSVGVVVETARFAFDHVP